MPERHKDWQPRLSALVRSRERAPMAWGTHDCALFAAAGLEAVYGVDLAEPYAGRYLNARGALRQLLRIDRVCSPIAFFDKHLGERLPVALAHMGHVVALDPAATDVLDDAGLGAVPGVCYGRVSFFVGREGLVSLPTLSLGWCYGFDR